MNKVGDVSVNISVPPPRVVASAGGPWATLFVEPPKRATILVVDDLDIHREALRRLLEDDGYCVLCARRTSEAMEILDQAPVDLVILDMLLPDGDGMEFCRRLRADRRTELIPALMLSRTGTVECEIEGIGSGADGVLSRPFHPDVLRARVRSKLRQKAIVDRLEDSETIILALAQTVEHRDYNTAGHCDRLAAMAVAMGMAMKLPSQHLVALHRGGYLHDMGKIAIPDSILLKKGPLTEAEWAVMRTHTLTGEDICRPIKCLSQVLPIVRSHHERWDGSGYPDGLAGDKIPLLARVLQFADIYDALTSLRSYKPAISSAESLCIMQEETDRGWHDPELMRLFLSLRHDAVREGAESNAAAWQDVQVMRDSLANLQSSLMRY